MFFCILGKSLPSKHIAIKSFGQGITLRNLSALPNTMIASHRDSLIWLVSMYCQSKGTDPYPTV